MTLQLGIFFWSNRGESGSTSSVMFWVAILIGLAGLIVILLPIIRGLWMRFKLARQRHRSIRQSRKDIFLRSRLAEVARGGREGEEAEPNVLRRRIAELKQNFADGTAALLSTGADARLRPWYILLGTPDSGRSTMMASSDLDLIDAGTGTNNEDARLRWWFHPNGTILDPAGDVLSPEWGNRGAAEFRQLLKFIEQERKAPELHGAVLVIEASKLMGSEEALDAEIGRLRSMLLDMSKVIGLDLPVYMLVSKCDQIEGMNTVMDSLAQGRQFRQMVGWSADEGGMDRFEETSLRNGLDTFCERMKFVGSSLVSRRDLLVQTDDSQLFKHSAELYSLPNTMRTVSERLTTVATSLFGEVSALHNGHLRGIYLTSVGNLDGEQSSVAMRTSGRFIRDIFVEKIFRERTLAGVGRTRFRKVYLSMLAAVAGLYLVLFLFIFGTITGRSIIDEETNELSLVWSKAEPRITNGDVMLSPLIGPDGKGGYELKVNSKLYRGGGESRQYFLDEVASNAYEPIPVPAAYRLTSPSMGTFVDDLLWRERRLAYRATFNPMVLGPLVNATVDMMKNSDEPWTANATTAFGGLLQLEQADANLPENWKYTFQVGPLLTSDMLSFVLAANEPANSPAEQAGFTAAVGSNILLSELGIQAMADSLVSAGTGSVEFAEAIVRGLQRYRMAWGDLAYRESLPLGQAEGAIKAVLDFQAGVQEMEELAKSVEVYTRFAPTEMQAKATVDDWNRLYDKIDQAITAWKKNSSALSWTEEESLVELVERATAQGETAVRRQFTHLLNRTVVLGEAQMMRSGQVLGSVAEELRIIRSEVEVQQRRIAENLLTEAKRLDPEIWIQVKKTRTSDPSILQANNKASTEKVLAPLMQAQVIKLVNTRMNERPSGSVANFNVTVSTQAMKNQRLYEEVTEKISSLGSDKSVPAFRSAMLMMTEVANWNSMFWAIANTIDSLPQSATQIAEQVASKVDESSEWFRPGIPLTRYPDSGNFDPAFNPNVATLVVAPWKEVRSQIDTVVSPTQVTSLAREASGVEKAKPVPSIMMLGQPQLNARYRKRVTALEGYASQYLDYWNQETRRAGEIALEAEWAEYQKGISSLHPFQVNSALLSYLQQVKLALGVEFLATNSPVGMMAKKQLTDVQTQITQLTPITTASAKAGLDRWKTLPQDSAAARLQLLNLTIQQFESNYFYMYTPGSPERVAYWDNLTRIGLESLSTSIAKGAQESMGEIVRIANQWPILSGVPRSPALSQADIDKMANTVGRFLIGPRTRNQGSTTASGTTGGKIPDEKNTTLLAGGKTGDSGVDYAIARLRDGLLPNQSEVQGGVVSAAAQQTPSQRVGNVVMALSSVPTPLAAAVVQPPIGRLLNVPKMPTAQRDPVSGAYQYRYLEIWVDGKMVGPRIETMRGDGAQLLRKDIRIPVSSSDLALRFYRSIDATDTGPVAEWKGSWSLIAAYLNPQTDSDQKTGIAWIPITFNNEFNLQCYWWLGIKLDRPLPPVAEWPTPGDWPYQPPVEKPVVKKPPAEKASAAKASTEKPSDGKSGS